MTKDFLWEQARVRQSMENALSLGPAGVFYAFVCKDALARAEMAASSGDPAAILASHRELRAIKYED